MGRIDHLLGRYGGLVDEVLALVEAPPGLAEPLEGAEEFLAAEIVYAVTHEGARHLDDVLTRRTRISIETFDRGVHAAGPAAALMAGELDWSEARTARREVDHYLRRVEAERQSQEKLDRPGGRRGPGQRAGHRLRSALAPELGLRQHSARRCATTR